MTLGIKGGHRNSARPFQTKRPDWRTPTGNRTVELIKQKKCQLRRRAHSSLKVHETLTIVGQLPGKAGKISNMTPGLIRHDSR